MQSINFTFTNSHLPIISHFSFIKQVAVGLKWPMLNVNLLKIGNCKLIIRAFSENYMPSPSLLSLKNKVNLARSYIIASEGGA